MVSTETSPAPTESAWNDDLLRNPHAVADKRTRVQRMFAAIAPSYDLNNRLHSLWMDQYWRRKAVKLAELKPDDRVVDVACGTGDLALRFEQVLWTIKAKRYQNIKPFQILGIDFTFEMLPIARRKAGEPWYDGPEEEIVKSPPLKPHVGWINADAQSLPLPDACCDVVSIAFGIRNVAEPAA